MSEPMTSPEIEDVLSSIRRLVSDDLRQARGLKAAPNAEAAEPELASVETVEGEADKLLLTPALRVISSVPESGAEDQEQPEPVAELSPTPADGPFVDGTEPGPEGDLAAAPEDAFHASASSLAAGDQEYDDAGMDELTLVSSKDMGEEGEILWAAAGEQVEDDVLTQPQAGSPTGPLHGLWTAQDVPGLAWAEDELWSEGDSDPVPFIAHPRKSEPFSAMGDQARVDGGEALAEAEISPAPISGPNAATEMAGESLTEPYAQPDLEAEFDAFTESLTASLRETVSETISETVLEESFQATSAFRRSAAGLDRMDQPAVALDEQKLREIVREIIREELASTLGERITRNVRKLVRVEINRALTTREFE